MTKKHKSTDKPASRGFTLQRDEWNRLVLVDAEGRRHVGVEPVRCFPVSCAEQWISICDPGGHEIACIEGAEGLPPPVRQLLEEELARHEFVPVIERILRVSNEADYSQWQIETDRGPTTFHTGSDDAVRRLDDRRVMIVDAAGIRYLIPDIDALDRPSRLILERFV
jgi:hypothetical protein